MDATSTKLLILGATSDFGIAMLAVLGAVLGIGVGFLVYKIGWRKVKGAAK